MSKLPTFSKKPANHDRKVAGVAIIAAAVGAAGAALLTPKSGKEVRGEITKDAKVLQTNSSKLIQGVKSKVTRKAKPVKKQAKSAVKKTKAKGTRAVTATKRTATKASKTTKAATAAAKKATK